MNIYQERLMDHYRHPRNKGTLVHPDFSSGVYNPSCGDSVTITARQEHGILKAIAFEGFGCVISQAAASLLTTAVEGLLVHEASCFSKEAMIALVGIECGPTRLKCVLLALEALQKALHAQSA